ncbi:GDSL-type esterase/lipase family protein [Nocardiopsis exhalans]|uniref:GDSL-type esterase/lipase family protein n=1 Tax=Nocardiopsis exhalans TaxID=163604 RepID=A0ABY5D5Q1_9ACTN|nr:GDSL-type esterase/lipase family protein [Nocardiopsis exhalans]USY19327.1 GDSL-type esterase/lipase family protein [Nocardiopsis exhalans]
MAAVAAAVVVAGCSGSGDEEATTTQSFYLSLGDSLTVGVQPDESGRAQETAEGYTDVLYRELKDADSTLQHERMGCGGEDTTTFIEGGIANCDTRYEAGSQLDQAEEFLREHGDQVDLVTLTIGGNNFTNCVDGVQEDRDPELGLSAEDIGVNEECVADGLERLETEVPLIAERLTEAAGPDTQIIAMTYYNPFLALALLEEPEAEATEGEAEASEDEEAEEGAEGAEAVPAEDADEGLAARTVEILGEVNESLTASYEAAGIDVADVDTVFDGANTEVPAGSDTGMPVNLQQICDLTWMCNVAQGPDIHTNLAGAQAIAEVFSGELR